jgi:hypothetical protein
MIYYIHVNQLKIRQNNKLIREGREDELANCFEIEFVERTKLVYHFKGGKILPCGARLVAMTHVMPKILR